MTGRRDPSTRPERADAPHRRELGPAVVALVVVAVAVVAALLTFARLGTPADIVFDETYYVTDARAMLETGVEDAFAVHPPLGKWVIGAGIALLGDQPAAWRAGGALLSVLAVAATTEAGRRLTGRLRFGVVAGGLLLLDGVWLTMARLAMLDSVLAAFVTFGTLALVIDHQRSTARASDVHGADGTVAAPTARRWPLAASGLLFGLAAATKWSGLLALGGAGLLATGWELAARRRRSGWSAGEVGRAAVPVTLSLVVVPIAIYAVSWVPWLAGYAATSTAGVACAAVPEGEVCDPSVPERVGGLVRHHRDIVTFHRELEADHPYRASATTWPAQLRPIVAFYESCDAEGLTAEGEPCVVAAGRASEIAVLGNPALWWAGLVLVPLTAAGLRRRDGAAAVPLVMLAAQFLPWLVVARPVFNFYTVPLVPMLALAVAVAGAELDRPARRAATLTLGAGAGVLAGLAALVLAGGAAAVSTAAVLAAACGVAVGSLVDARREERSGTPPPPTLPIGTLTSGLVLAAAAALLVHLSPLWLALPVDEESLRQRWWLRSWV